MAGFPGRPGRRRPGASPPRLRHRLLRGAGLGVVAAVALAAPADAHAQLESTQPNQSSVLAVAPTRVVLHFGEPVEIDFGSIRVIGPDGRRVDEGGTTHPGGDDHAVAIGLPAHLGAGTYVVAWRVISADSHPVHGAFVFSVGTAAGAGKAGAVARALESATGSTPVGVTFFFVRLAGFVGLVLIVGVGAMVIVIRPSAANRRAVSALMWWSWTAIVVSTVAGVAVQGVYAAGLPLGDALRPSLFDEVLHTRFGEVALARLVLCAGIVPVIPAVVRVLGRRPRPALWTLLGAVLSLGLLSTPGLAGHASTGGSAIVGLALDVVHLAAASVWLGGLALLLTLALSGRRQDSDPDPVWAAARHFSGYAFGAVVAVVATGVAQSVREVGSIYALTHTTYGRTLLGKVGAVALLVVGGAVSRRAVHRAGAARPAPGAHRLRRSVAAELAVGLVVLGVTALLVNAAPAKQAASQPFSDSFEVLGVQVNAIVDPARVGPGNQFHFYVLGRLGQPVAIPELDASISLPAQRVGPLALPVVVSGPGHYRASDVDIPLAGSWTLKITVRTTPIDEQAVVATFPVH